MVTNSMVSEQWKPCGPILLAWFIALTAMSFGQWLGKSAGTFMFGLLTVIFCSIHRYWYYTHGEGK